MLDPAADAGMLLRRIGFATLTLAVPVAALVSRRAAVVLAPIGVALIVLASAIDGAGPGLRKGLFRSIATPTGLCAVLVFGWAALSLTWTPFPASAADKYLNLVMAAGLAMVGAAALPERMRAANLYLMAIGAGGAALFAAILAIFGAIDMLPGAEGDSGSLERGLIILAMFIWPAIGWLTSRNRRIAALMLAACALIVALIGSSRVVPLALIVGSVTFGIVMLKPREGPRWIAHALAASIAIAPLLPFALRPLLKAAFGALDPTTLAARVWIEVVRIDPLRLITGHGLDSAFRGRFSGLLPPESPTSALFEIWYDLGLVGAFATAVALWFALTRIGKTGGPLAGAKIGALTTAFVISALGLGAGQAWWPTTLGIIGLAFVAAERGQFRTTRPKASIWQAAKDH
jgi:hypothetical protein